MSKRFTISLVIFLLATFAVVIAASNIMAPVWDPDIYTDDIKMVIKEGSLTPEKATVIITDNLDFEADYSQEFHIERLDDNKWQKLRASSKTTWLLRLYSLDENGTLELDQHWGDMYGKLDKGTYRLVKYISVPNENGMHKDMFRGRYSLYKFFTEFEIK